MKKQTLLYVLLLIGIMFITTPNVYAKEDQNDKINNRYNINIMIKNMNEASIANTNLRLNEMTQILDCSGTNSILGSVNDPDSVAWLLQKILNYIRIIGPFLVLLLSSIDYLKAIFSSDDETLSKTHKKFIVRLVLAASLFVLPTIVSVLLNVLGLTSNEICGLQ